MYMSVSGNPLSASRRLQILSFYPLQKVGPMNIAAHLDVDLIALESPDHITLMLDLTAPISDSNKDRPGQAVQIVLDRSGSMDGPPLDAAKGSLLKLIDRLAPQDFFGLVAFDDTALVVAPTRTMADHNIFELRHAIATMQSGGSTDISAGYLMGLREVKAVNAPGGSTVLLISDGHANSGEQDAAFFTDVATKSAQEKITTASIGLGNGYDETILEALAQGGGGAHRFAANIDEAITAISAEVDDLLAKSVVNAVLRLKPLPGMHGAPSIELLQRLPYWMDGETYVVQLGDLYAGENINVPQIASLGLCTIAEITIASLNLAERQDISVTLPVNVNVVPGDQAAGRIANPIVRAQRLVITAQSEKALATEEMRKGDIKGATKRLNENATLLRNEASRINIEDEGASESLVIINAEVEELGKLAHDAQFQAPEYNVKRMQESYSRKTRSREVRREA